MSSLKQKIREKVIIIDEQAGNRYCYKSTEVVRLKDVLGLLDEATKQIRDDLDWYERCLKACSECTTTRPICEERVHLFRRFLAVLEGEKK